MEALYPCPCCGYLVFGEPPGSDDICAICGWQDDIVQLRWVNFPGGANKESLIEAQRTYALPMQEEDAEARSRPSTSLSPNVS